MTGNVTRTMRRDDGSTAAEYALLIALIAAVIVLAVVYVGQQVLPKYTHTGSCIASTDTC